MCGHISAAVKMGEGKELSDVIKINAANNAKSMVENSEILKNAVNNSGLVIESGYYNLGSGKVDF